MDINATNIIDQIFNTNTLLVMLVTGVVVWTVRQVVPDKVEEMKVWKVVLRVAPVIVGALVALIPGLRPSDNLIQSAAIGLIGGSFAQTVYDTVREGAGQKIKAMMGSKAQRKQFEDETE